ncbi:MAG: cytochrome c3 family protein [Desulfovibrio sp.]|nr:cytochrome c3 family protein [Desulfovibrio sp.]
MPSINLRSACLCCCSLFLVPFVLASPQGVQADELLVVKTPAVDSPTMPVVMFNHDAHVAYVEKHDSDCSRCHRVTSEGLSVSVLDVRLQKADRQVTYMHTACTDCHKASGRGPSIGDCRSCHAQGNTLRAMK